MGTGHVVYSFRGERLGEHSYLVLRLYATAFGERHEKVLAKRLELPIGDVACMMRAACWLHDVGKALNEFQRSMSFAFHELVSAYFTYETLAQSLKREPLAVAAALAVMQHHQAMRSLEEVVSEGLRELEHPLQSGIDKEGVYEEMRIAAQLSEHLLLNADKLLQNLRQAIEKFSEEPIAAMQSFDYTVKKWLQMRNLPEGDEEVWRGLQYYLPMLSAPLQLADNFAALLTRGGRVRQMHAGFLLLLRAAERCRGYPARSTRC